MKKRLLQVYYTLPVQLLKLHAKHNLLMLSLWFVLILFLNGSIGSYFGFEYLFLDPEYMGQINFWSFFMIGLSFGVFLLAWNSSVYILNSYRFPFLASLYRPYATFSLNNAIVPVAFVFYYLVKLIHFQWYNEYSSQLEIITYCSGFLTGCMVLLCMTMIYFQLTNTDIKTYGKSKKVKIQRVLRSVLAKRKEKQIDWIAQGPYKNAWPVDYYLSDRLRFKLVRNVAHYNEALLERVFRQNHINALVIQSVTIILLILLGALVEYEQMRLPTAASFFLLLSVITTIIGAISYWLVEWRFVFLIGLIVGISYLMKSGYFSFSNKAYGLDYETDPVTYTIETLDSLSDPSHQEQDMDTTKVRLVNWLQKMDRKYRKSKPKLVIVSASGGGLRASLWTFYVMRVLSEITKGRFMDQTMLLTGSSGGMWGAAIFRELFYRYQSGKITNAYDDSYLDYASADLANSVAFTFLVNDVFIPWVERDVNGYRYVQDRGYMFEQQLIENTEGILDMNMSYYKSLEEKSEVPTMILSPVIMNDNRLLMMSTMGVSYLMHTPRERAEKSEIDAIDFFRMFERNNPHNLRFVTALRMNGTFPFILPSVQLPTKPVMRVMDAGFRDNYGVETASRFSLVFQEWIQENTGGLVFVNIQSFEDSKNIESVASQSLPEMFLQPLRAVFSIDEVQRYHHANYFSNLKEVFGESFIETIDFVYRPSTMQRKASLSLHLTQKEKNDILNAMNLSENRDAMQKLRHILK